LHCNSITYSGDSSPTAFSSTTHTFYIIRPHHSATYVDVACCHRCSSVVCRSVTIVSPAKTAELIKMPFGLWTRVGPRNHVLDGVQISHGKWLFRGGKGWPIAVSCAKTAEVTETSFGTWTQLGPKSMLDGGAHVIEPSMVVQCSSARQCGLSVKLPGPLVAITHPKLWKTDLSEHNEPT